MMPKDKSAEAFLKRLNDAGISQNKFARFIQRDRRTLTRWTNDATPVPNYAWFALETLLQYGPRRRKAALERKSEAAANR
jgi:hypothetical protein